MVSKSQYNLRIFLDSTKDGIWGTEVPVGSRGEAQVGRMGDEPGNPVGCMGPSEADDIFGLKEKYAIWRKIRR